MTFATLLAETECLMSPSLASFQGLHRFQLNENSAGPEIEAIKVFSISTQSLHTFTAHAFLYIPTL